MGALQFLVKHENCTIGEIGNNGLVPVIKLQIRFFGIFTHSNISHIFEHILNFVFIVENRHHAHFLIFTGFLIVLFEEPWFTIA